MESGTEQEITEGRGGGGRRRVIELCLIATIELRDGTP